MKLSEGSKNTRLMMQDSESERGDPGIRHCWGVLVVIFGWLGNIDVVQRHCLSSNRSTQINAIDAKERIVMVLTLIHLCEHVELVSSLYTILPSHLPDTLNTDGTIFFSLMPFMYKIVN